MIDGESREWNGGRRPRTTQPTPPLPEADPRAATGATLCADIAPPYVVGRLGAVQIDDFFREEPDPLGFGSPATVLRDELFSQLRAGPVPDDDDLATAISLARLVHAELEAYGTSGGEKFTEAQIEAAQRCLRAVLSRHGIDLRLPWRNFAGFRTYWLQHDGYGSWQARRDLLDTFFKPALEELDRLEEAQFHAIVADAVSPHGGTGWPAVDNELTELKRRFRSATTPQDYRDVGNRSIGVLEALSRTVYDPARHLRPGEVEPPPDKTKQRLGRYVENSLAGADNAAIRAVAIKVIELAHAVKHSREPSRRDAGITADAVILLANILRRVDQQF